jgi:TonB family protein
MKFDKQLSSLMSAALLCGTFTTPAMAQQAAGSGPVAPAPTTTVTPAPKAKSEEALLKSTPPLTEEALQARYVGKLVFLRGSYLGDDLQFDVNGKVIGSPALGSFTLSAFEIRKVKLSKRKLDLEADRYGLHFFGALPYEDDTKTFDKVKISKKPVHIAIDRELIVIPKVKKEKNKKDAPAPQAPAAPQTSPAPNAATATPPPAPNVAATELPGAVSPAHSAMLMNKALDNIFANDIDQAMMSHLPDYWQEYFTSKSQHRQYMPADGNIKIVSEGMTPPKVMNSIDPSSNEYAQKYGIAGMELLRTVVDANGIPRQMAIARPIGFGLDEKAVDAIKNSRFRPATLNGQPVPVVVDLVVTFRIYSNRTKPGSVIKGSKEAVLAASVSDTDSPKSSGSDASLKP